MTEDGLERALAMWMDYVGVERNTPLRKNPMLDLSKKSREVLVNCECGKQYRLFVNGDNPLPGLTKENAPVYCSCCGRHCSEFRTISGHSCGTFNVTITKGIASSEFWPGDEVPV